MAAKSGRLIGQSLLVAVFAVVMSTACQSPGVSDVPELAAPPADSLLTQADAPPLSALPIAARPPSQLQAVKRMLIASAERHGVNPYLVMGIAWWESGWDQRQVSSTGAIGIMQVEPATAQSAGPLLLHRVANIHDPADNIELGTAVLREDLDMFQNDLAKALIAYYAGPAAVTGWKDQSADAQRYVWGIFRLAQAFSNGTGPA
ncbi:MAG TPA: transglycosylase SLT domain-containing protein [Candidatus Dormibacteraeota bacterium]|nr:transglycosylase SLT domain-containing protein [Candidatus Dormibacteraeota bacterium]